MESSFFEYRDKTGVESESDNEIIDGSFEVEESFSVKKKLPKKNQTVFVAESDDSTGEDTEEYEVPQNLSLSLHKSNFVESQVISSSEDDASPEIVPKKRPPVRSKSTESSDSPLIGRKVKKRMILLDSDTDNSIIIEHDRHKKITCVKDTPLKVYGKKIVNKINDDDDDEAVSESDDEITNDGTNIDTPLKENRKLNDRTESESDENDKLKTINIPSKTYSKKDRKTNDTICDSENEENMNESDDNADSPIKIRKKKNRKVIDDDTGSDVEGDSEDQDEGEENCEEEEEIDEEQLVMSRATRMSIMGIIPKDDESDDSDYIQSDESNIKSREGSLTSSRASSMNDLPDAGMSIAKTPQKATESEEIDSDVSRISCSPFGSPAQEVTVETYESPIKSQSKVLGNKNDLRVSLMNKNMKDHKTKGVMNKDDDDKENLVDDDVAIVEHHPEIIALSSDEEDVVVVKKSPVAKKSPSVRKSPGLKKSPKVELNDEVEFIGSDKENTIKQYLAPPKSYPNQIVYVKKHVKENELNKLNALKEDLQNVRYILDTMDLESLPDGGAKLVQRLSDLERQHRTQGDKVANMVVEPEQPTAADMARDGFDKGMSWDDLQKASNAVQPRMFGKQAMSTHMAERNLILDRLRDLYESLGSRPPDSELATQPRLISSQLMQHQLHALAWLQWRETQNPRGGILADDMGLGKTITMISLIACDKEKNIEHGDDDDEDDVGNSKLPRGGTLVVCPASLVQQWAGEVQTHARAHALTVCQHHGPQRSTQPHRLAHHDIVLTTYSLLQRDNEKNGVLMRVGWRRVILDEAHVVRNHKSATSQSVCALVARRRWTLTGTPVQNKDLDLFALLKFLRCTPFDELTMWKKWIDNKSMGGQERLSAIMRAILLRRTKQQLQQKGQLNSLPDRETHMCEVTLTKDEMNVYQKVLVFSKTLFAAFLHQRAEQAAGGAVPLTASAGDTYASMHKRMIALQGAKPVKSHEILVLLLRLRQVCCHCSLIAAMLDPTESGGDAADTDLLNELHKLSLHEPNRKSLNKHEEDEDPGQEGTSVNEALKSVLSPNNPVFNPRHRSSKIKAVMDCLQDNVFANKGDKAVVVSQWTSVLRLVGDELRQRSVRHVVLDGAVPVGARHALVASLNDPTSDVKVMLLSLSAGGVGLNLCGANHLLLLDPHWNPQLEEQAQDRIYRVGQTKLTHVYRFMCVDTVEQSIRKLQLAKLELANNVLTGAKNNNASKLTIEDLKTLFNMGPSQET